MFEEYVFHKMNSKLMLCYYSFISFQKQKTGLHLKLKVVGKGKFSSSRYRFLRKGITLSRI